LPWTFFSFVNIYKSKKLKRLTESEKLLKKILVVAKKNGLFTAKTTSHGDYL